MHLKTASALLLGLGFLLPLASRAQNTVSSRQEVGLPYLTCFGTKDHGGGNQDWVFAQDSRGMIYVGDNLGVLEYDGAAWRLILTATNNVVRALGVGDDDTVYVGSATDFGYLAPDDTGTLGFVSLFEYIPEEDRIFNDIWSVHPTPEGVYFQARERLFRFTRAGDGWDVKVWRPEGVFYYAFWLDGTYYVHQGDVGLMKMVDDELQLLPGGDQFSGERLQVFLPYERRASGTDLYLVGTFNRGVFLFDGQAFTPFQTEADGLLESATLYKGALLPGEAFGLATIDGGLLVIDREGRMIQHMDRSTGLSSDAINAMLVDRSDLVWFSPENSICQFEARSPLTRYDASSGLSGFSTDIVRRNGVLYVSTGDGVYYLDSATSSFKQVTGFSTGISQSWSFLEAHGQLLVATGTGIYRIEGSRAQAVTQNVVGVSSPSAMHQSLQDPGVIFVGESDGMSMLRYDEASGRWTEEGKVPGITEEVRFIVEPEPGLLWLGSQTQSAMRVRFPEGAFGNPIIDRFDYEDGLPGRGGTAVFLAGGQLVFAMKEGVARFDEATGRFVPDSLLSNVVGFGGSAEEYSIAADRQRNLWVNFGKETAVLRRQTDGSYRPDKTALLRFSDEPAYDIYLESDGVVWFGSNSSLIRYDPAVEKDYTATYTAMVRRVTVDEDSVLYGGAHMAVPVAPTLEARQNALRFEYAAPTYDNPLETLYQTILDGFDEHWSAWTKETRRDYTNLPPGDFIFRVKARNIYENESAVATYAFTILPPWYRTAWAYAVYVLLLGGLIYGAGRVMQRRMMHKESERARLLEAELRAEAAEAQAKTAAAQADVLQAEARTLQAENERKQNVERLSEIGRAITASLSFEEVIETVYEHVNALMDATVFGVGLYNVTEQRIDFPATKEKGETLKPYFNRLDDDNRLAVWCFKHGKEIVSNDYAKDYTRYVKQLQAPVAGEHTQSLIYLPLVHQNKVLGVITAQSFEKDAYTEYHVNIFRNLAAYAAIALDNAEAYRRLHATVDELNRTLMNLKATQEQLIQSEKMASLGELTAGIAHEIKNPLNFVNNFAELCGELAEELDEELEANKDRRVAEVEDELKQILADLKINAAKINEHGRRADGIVRAMMQHASGARGERQPMDVNVLVEEYVNLAYHGMRAQVPDFNVEIVRDYDASAGAAPMIPQEIGRVLLNLLNNAFYAVNERVKGGDAAYMPTVAVRTRPRGSSVEIRVEDNGPGIPREVQDKIFEPFYTTKPTGSGTGLGLSLSHDIVAQGHGGSLSVESAEGKGATFIILLPRGGAG